MEAKVVTFLAMPIQCYITCKKRHHAWKVTLFHFLSIFIPVFFLAGTQRRLSYHSPLPHFIIIKQLCKRRYAKKERERLPQSYPVSFFDRVEIELGPPRSTLHKRIKKNTVLLALTFKVLNSFNPAFLGKCLLP